VVPTVAVSEPPDQERPPRTGEVCLDGDWDFVGNTKPPFTRAPPTGTAPAAPAASPAAPQALAGRPAHLPRPPARPAARRHAGAHGLDRHRRCWGGAYTRHLDPEQHTVSKRGTQKIERKQLTLRMCIKRLVCQTICFSKSTQMHDIVIGLFVNRYAFGRAV
jgi:hypothetical protein